MRWEYKPKTELDRVKKRFAIFPVVVENEWVWLESYCVYTIEGYAGPEVIRFHTFERAKEWLEALDESN